MEMLTFAEHIHPRIAKLGMRDAAYAIRARDAVTDKFSKVFSATQSVGAAHDAAMGLLKDFEDRADAYLAEQARQRQAQLTADQQNAVAAARARALANAEDRPMRPAEICAALSAAGRRIRLREARIEVAPISGLALDIEMQIVAHAAELGDYLRQLEDFRTIAVVPTVGAEDSGKIGVR